MIDYNREYVEASKLFETFTYDKEYDLRGQLKDGVEKNKFKIAYSSICRTVENILFLVLDILVPDTYLSILRVTLTLMQQSYPLTAPVIHFSKLPSYDFNPIYSWFNKDGYLANEIFKHFYPTTTFIDLCDSLIKLVTDYKLLMSKIVIPPQPHYSPIVEDSNSLDLLDEKDFKLVKETEIGHGGFGECYHYIYKGESVCVKNLHQNTLTDIKYAKREIEALKKLNHPNILKMYGVTYMNKKYQMVTKYASEGDLYKYMDKNQQYVQEDTLRFYSIFIKLVIAVSVCHENKIVHRDIKPGNIFMEKGNNPILGDFGFARSIDESNGHNDITRCYTYPYAAPEQILYFKPITNKCDIYALGIVGYYIMTGIDIALEIFEKYKQLKTDSQYIIPFKPNLNKTLYTLFQDCCQFDPDKRPSAAEIYSRLSTYKGPLYVDSLE
ncbi:hypothetical protein WA158_005987 [Blastocystis sp. Blastoise]